MGWNLPIPIIRGYGFTGTSPLIKTQFEQGPDRNTRYTKQYRSNLRCTIYLTKDEVRQAWEFWESPECALGAAWFDMEIFTGGALAVHEVRMLSPSIRPAGFGFMWSCTLNVRQRVAA